MADRNDEPIASTCPSGANDCPAVFLAAEPGHVIVQGYVVDNPTLGTGEGWVRVPIELIKDAHLALSTVNTTRD
ncbi:hypothetical protein ACG83_30500 [Frankia sp. R43]|uniref:hypothetical protein n=1 Tax=Frankia sp. R43 TaxID=269536 RepID=UPI0006C9F5A7|nr:hypothetical protein [Frankia sp. R43]KPM51924.1 hypothetical protein ACG83_30500 [Frankia sp. R43]